MKEFLEKLSSYNLFNYLFPGIIFVILTKELCNFSLIQENILLDAFLYYFIGMVISRIGSLIIEPILKKIGFLKYSEYKDFVAASKKDKKIELFSEVNNTYRTLCSLFAMLGILKIYLKIANLVMISKRWNIIILLILLFIMFLFSYRKQSNYISKRVDINK